jgi:hypothetical protein
MESGKKVFENGIYSTRSKQMIPFGAYLRIQSSEEESEEDWEEESEEEWEEESEEDWENINPNKRMRYSNLQLLVF